MGKRKPRSARSVSRTNERDAKSERQEVTRRKIPEKKPSMDDERWSLAVAVSYLIYFGTRETRTKGGFRRGIRDGRRRTDMWIGSGARTRERRISPSSSR